MFTTQKDTFVLHIQGRKKCWVSVPQCSEIAIQMSGNTVFFNMKHLE